MIEKHYEVEERLDTLGVWTAEAIGSDGEVYQALFAGPNAEDRAREYADYKNAVSQPERRRV